MSKTIVIDHRNLSVLEYLGNDSKKTAEICRIVGSAQSAIAPARIFVSQPFMPLMWMLKFHLWVPSGVDICFLLPLPFAFHVGDKVSPHRTFPKLF